MDKMDRGGQRGLNLGTESEPLVIWTVADWEEKMLPALRELCRLALKDGKDGKDDKDNKDEIERSAGT